MSLATNTLGLLSRSSAAHHSVQWTTQHFCDMLEKAVDLMQSGKFSPALMKLIFGEGVANAAEFMKLVWRAVNAGRIYMLACVVVLFYDYIVTFDLEVNHIWKRKKNIISYLFLINRYLPLATYLFVIISVFDSNATSYFCLHVFSALPPAMIATSEAIIGMLRMAKVRALWLNDMNKWFCLATIIVYLAQTALSIASAVAIQGVGPLFGLNNRIGCFIIFHSGSMPRIILHWFTNLVFNMMIFCFILRKALKVRRAGGDAQLADVLVRDAVMFLIVLSTVKIANLIMLIMFPYWNAVNWSFNHIVDVILTSHLIFNLRSATGCSSSANVFETSRQGMLQLEASGESSQSGQDGDIEALSPVQPVAKQAFAPRGRS